MFTSIHSLESTITVIAEYSYALFETMSFQPLNSILPSNPEAK